MRVGFIGLGNQGGPMAARIVEAGMPLTVWARRPEALAPFVAKGATAAASVAELGTLCDHIGICVVDDAGVASICEELIPAMRAGSRLVIHSTILPESCIDLAARCTSRGVGFIDAPVSGGGAAADSGTLTVMCGGDETVFEAARPVFETFAKLVVLLGGAGAGQRAKIVNNALLAANMGLAHAAMNTGEALGLDRTALAALIKESSGRSYGFEIYARLPGPSAFAQGTPLLIKDLGLLGNILPDHGGAKALIDAATPFFAAASGT